MNSSDSEEVLTPLLSIPTPGVIDDKSELVYLGMIQTLFQNAVDMLEECKKEFDATFDHEFASIIE